jgi:hypothetical protein
MGWKHDQLDSKSSYHSCSHIFAHKCVKIESKCFQSISNHHTAQQWVHNLLYTKFGKLLYNRNMLKIFLKHISQNVFKNTFTLESLIYYYFESKSWKHISIFENKNIQESRKIQYFSYFKPTFHETCDWKEEKNLFAVVKNLFKWTLNM